MRGRGGEPDRTIDERAHRSLIDGIFEIVPGGAFCSTVFSATRLDANNLAQSGSPIALESSSTRWIQRKSCRPPSISYSPGDALWIMRLEPPVRRIAGAEELDPAGLSDPWQI